MGSLLSTNNPRRRHPNFEKASPDDDNSSIAGQKCLSVKKFKWKKKRINREPRCELPPPDQKITTMVKSLTLREWILSSPGKEPECISGHEPFVFSPTFRRVFPSPPEVDETSISMTAMPCKARDSFSLERPLKISGEDDREEEREEGAVSSVSICRTESGRTKKKVSFRLPEEADIIIFYSPRDEY
ncbi:hypothetical protein ACJRO7_017690 [Eucalyptus globulus]|uniref:Uncharacterized protein n=1 Tax=Eucalyptus globulus TaxID=34317 RepID=A0ABD3KR14_EUCGL